MSRYIDVDKLQETIYKRVNNPAIRGWLNPIINEQPIADVKEVKHGQWTKDQNFNDDLVRCSACHILSDRQPNYCPYCGARMDGGVKE